MSTESAVFPWQSRLLVLVGLTLWLVALWASVGEILASQAPDSPFHWGILPGPFHQLHHQSFFLGTLLLGSALLWPRLWPAPRAGSISLACLLAGASVQIASLVWGAVNGMLVVQIADPRPDARLMFLGRALGLGLVLAGCSGLGLRALQMARARPN